MTLAALICDLIGLVCCLLGIPVLLILFAVALGVPTQ